jgi:hypothetical protein
MIKTETTNTPTRTRRRQTEGYDPVPNVLMGWLTRKAKSRSSRIHLAAVTDGTLGQIILSSYDEYDNNIGDEVIEVNTFDHLMAT